VLGRLWKRTTEPGAQWGHSTAVLSLGPLPRSANLVSDVGTQVVPRSAPSKRRRQPVEFEDVYPTEKAESEAVVHARALLELMREYCTPGKYIEKGQLERMYGELCQAEGWQRRNWVAIARQLGKMTDKRTGKAGGKKRVGYRVPRS